MGCYGIGPGRIMAAAVEQNHDEHGIALAEARSRPTTSRSSRSRPRGRRRWGSPSTSPTSSSRPGLDVLVDDRDRRPGEKFADADLIGCPFRITVGKKALEDGKVDVLERAGRVEERVTVSDVVARVTGGA